jgi:hypothetical protein
MLVSVFRRGNPIHKKVAFLSLLTSVLAVQAISAAANGVTYKVRLENGVDQYYLLEVPYGITPVKLKPSEWNQPQYATDKISPNSAVLAAVSWAGGLEDHDSGSYPNSLANVSGKKAGGFYHASYIKVGDVQYQPGSVPKLSRAFERADWSNSPVILCRRFGGWVNCAAGSCFRSCCSPFSETRAGQP